VTPSRLKSRGIELPALGFGGAQLGNIFRETTEDEASRAVAEAWRSGFRYFDTAPHYGLGLSETRFGDFLGGYARSEFVLSSKAGRILDPTPEQAHLTDEFFEVPRDTERRFDFSRDGVFRSIESSLARLKMDYLDIAYLHDPDDYESDALSSGVEALCELRDQGVVRAVGAGMNQAEMLTRFVSETDVDVVMVAGRLSLIDRRATEELLPAAGEKGVAVVVAGVYNSGLLSKEIIPDNPHFDYQEVPESMLALARRAQAFLADAGVSLPAAALQFPARHEAVTSIVVGARTAEQVTATLARWEARIPEKTWSELERHLGFPS
jgi:D-threo-aldose 1-dehydrogenase